MNDKKILPAPCPKPLLTHVIAASAIAMMIAGCGGGGSSPAPAPAPAAAAEVPPPVLNQAANKVPVGHAGTAQVARVGVAVQLDGSASQDEDGDALSYAWTLTGKPAASNATLTDSTSARPALVPDVPGAYVATLVVSDGKSKAEAVTVKVLAETVAFDSIPGTLPPNVPSYGFEATALSSLGDQVQLASGAGRQLRGVTVTMSSWACESGDWFGTCATTANATFQHPVTIRLFDAAGTPLATQTKTFTMPYRPSPDLTCTDKLQWRATDGKCYNGYAFKIDFDLSELGVTLPDTVVYEIAYDTRDYGAAPRRVTGPYDSLNVGAYVASTGPSVGVDVDPAANRQNGAAKADTHSPMVQIVVTDAP